MKYKYLFFDFDGTISDTYEGIKEIMSLTFNHFGTYVPDNMYTKYIGPPITETFESYYGKEKAKEVLDFFNYNYGERNALFKSKVFDGIEECFIKCKEMGYKLGVATCKKQEDAKKLLEYFGLNKYIDFVSGLCYNKRETKEETLLYAVNELGISVEDAVMIGDTIFDVEGAQKVNMDCILCLWGFGEYDKLNQSNIVFRANKPIDICDFLQD